MCWTPNRRLTGVGTVKYTKNVSITSNPEILEKIRDTQPKTQPIEVWLSQPNLEVTCRIVYEDERTDTLDIGSLSMRGAQREVTGYLIKQGYTPAGRWEIEHLVEGDEREAVVEETSRRFRPGNSVANLLTPEHGGDGPVTRPTLDSQTHEFYIYENWTNTFALIHLGTCSFCNHGQGVQGRGNKTPNGQWHGVFPSLDEALSVARRVAGGHSNGSAWNVRPCGVCLRGALRHTC